VKNEIIETKNLTAVSNLDFAVSRGGILGFLGLDGAGKTTSIRMMTGLLQADFWRNHMKGF
jgi:ABC-type multidrug transport system ATPase subunit